MGADGGNQQCVAVAAAFGDIVRADIAPSAGLVVNGNGLAQ